MTLPLVIYRSLRQHALSTVVTSVSIALAGGLLMSVWTVRQQSQRAFTNMSAGFDAVLGARGSKLQLVLNAIFHLESSPGNIHWEDYLEVAEDPRVEAAIPIAVGDNYRGFRLVGTITNLFSAMALPDEQQLALQPSGRLFDPMRREAVVGHIASTQLGLRVGDQFRPYHGLIFDPRSEHRETYVVTGLLAPTGTPADRVIWVPLAGIQHMEGHDPEASEDLSAVLIRLKSESAVAGQIMSSEYNREGERLTLAWPVAQVVAQLFDKIAWFDRVLELVSYLVALVAMGSVLASIHNTMNERRREVAILRALGARRILIFGSVVGEAATIGAIGMILAFGVHILILFPVSAIIRSQTGVVLDPLSWHNVMFWAPLAMILLCAMAGIVPAVKAYRTDVAENLAPLS